MSGTAKTTVLAEEGGNQGRKRTLHNNEQCGKRAKTDEMSASEKKSNFSLLTPNSNGAAKSSLTSLSSKHGATAKKLVIKNFKSMFTLKSRH